MPGGPPGARPARSRWTATCWRVTTPTRAPDPTGPWRRSRCASLTAAHWGWRSRGWRRWPRGMPRRGPCPWRRPGPLPPSWPRVAVRWWWIRAPRTPCASRASPWPASPPGSRGPTRGSTPRCARPWSPSSVRSWPVARSRCACRPRRRRAIRGGGGPAQRADRSPDLVLEVRFTETCPPGRRSTRAEVLASGCRSQRRCARCSTGSLPSRSSVGSRFPRTGSGRHRATEPPRRANLS